MPDENIVLTDTTGAYYLVDRAAVEAGRVPEDDVAALEDALEPEVAGHGILAPTSGLRVVGTVRAGLPGFGVEPVGFNQGLPTGGLGGTPSNITRDHRDAGGGGTPNG